MGKYLLVSHLTLTNVDDLFIDKTFERVLSPAGTLSIQKWIRYSLALEKLIVH